MDPTPQDILDLGEDAERLLSDPSFTSVINDLSAGHMAAIASSPPGETGRDARDYHHLLHYALAEIVGVLKGRQSTAQEMKKLLELEQDDDL